MSPRAFCTMSPRVTVCGEVKAFWAEAVGKPSAKCAIQSHAVDSKARDLSMARPKRRYHSVEGRTYAR